MIDLRMAIALAAGVCLASCSSSLGGSGGGSAPAKTYIILPSGQAVPAKTQPDD